MFKSRNTLGRVLNSYCQSRKDCVSQWLQVFRKCLCSNYSKHTVLAWKDGTNAFLRCLLYDTFQSFSGNAGDNGHWGAWTQDLFYAWGTYSEDACFLLKYNSILMLGSLQGSVRIVCEQISVSTLQKSHRNGFWSCLYFVFGAHLATGKPLFLSL